MRSQIDISGRKKKRQRKKSQKSGCNERCGLRYPHRRRTQRPLQKLCQVMSKKVTALRSRQMANINHTLRDSKRLQAVKVKPTPVLICKHKMAPFFFLRKKRAFSAFMRNVSKICGSLKRSNDRIRSTIFLTVTMTSTRLAQA